MKRPEKYDDLVRYTPKQMMEYVGFLEGWIAATKATLGQVTVGQVKPRKSTQFANLCQSCTYSGRIPAPEQSDRKTLIICNEPTYGQGKMLIQQCRQLGPCGPEATLRETAAEPETTLHGIPEKEFGGDAA